MVIATQRLTVPSTVCSPSNSYACFIALFWWDHVTTISSCTTSTPRPIDQTGVVFLSNTGRISSILSIITPVNWPRANIHSYIARYEMIKLSSDEHGPLSCITCLEWGGKIRSTITWRCARIFALFVRKIRCTRKKTLFNTYFINVIYFAASSALCATIRTILLNPDCSETYF